ncbi:MAG: ATP-binding protein, partial [Clostridia bacterium]|nr:ATP-binding protein [Clostridia bacterium]
FYGVIINETDRMTRIVKDLLILSRLDYAKMDWKISRFSLEESLENVTRAMEMDAKNHKHELSLNIYEELPEMNGDKGRVEQVFVNIISNAIKYTPDGGKITVSATNDEGRVEITVQDTGIGIPQKDLDRIFDRFYRVDKARSRARGGTGLGLAITKEIVEYHGGTIKVESELNVGTKVIICFDTNREVPHEN